MEINSRIRKIYFDKWYFSGTGEIDVFLKVHQSLLRPCVSEIKQENPGDFLVAVHGVNLPSQCEGARVNENRLGEAPKRPYFLSHVRRIKAFVIVEKEPLRDIARGKQQRQAEQTEESGPG